MRNLLLSTLLLLSLSLTDADFTCYQCSSNINQYGVEYNVQTTGTVSSTTSCANVIGISTASSVTATGAFLGCQTYYKYSSGVTTIQRGPPPIGQVSEVNSCVSSADTTTCYCNTTSNCNNHPVTVPTTYTCYFCESSAYYDNGCGATVDSTSSYVQQFQGCSACSKQMTVNSDLTLTYSRGCLRDMNIDDECVTNADTSASTTTTTCSCTGSFCNSAEITERNFFFIFTAVLLSAFYKLIF